MAYLIKPLLIVFGTISVYNLIPLKMMDTVFKLSGNKNNKILYLPNSFPIPIKKLFCTLWSASIFYMVSITRIIPFRIVLLRKSLLE